MRDYRSFVLAVVASGFLFSSCTNPTAEPQQGPLPAGTAAEVLPEPPNPAGPTSSSSFDTTTSTPVDSENLEPETLVSIISIEAISCSASSDQPTGVEITYQLSTVYVPQLVGQYEATLFVGGFRLSEQYQLEPYRTENSDQPIYAAKTCYANALVPGARIHFGWNTEDLRPDPQPFFYTPPPELADN